MLIQKQISSAFLLPTFEPEVDQPDDDQSSFTESFKSALSVITSEEGNQLNAKLLSGKVTTGARASDRRESLPGDRTSQNNQVRF